MARSIQDDSHDEELRVEAIDPRRYYIVWIALLVLTAVTVIVARVHLGHGLGLVVALVIAIAKASLVALFFMHLWDHGGANRIVLVTSLVFLLLLLGLTIADNASRFSLTNPPHQETMRHQPPGPDILSPSIAPGTSSRHQGPRDRAPQEQR
jgi:cytochrome c oxidase subunit IV